MTNRPPVFHLPDDEPSGGDPSVPPDAQGAAPDTSSPEPGVESAAYQSQAGAPTAAADHTDGDQTSPDSPPPEAQAEAALDAAQSAARKLADQTGDPASAAPVDLPRFQPGQSGKTTRGIDLLSGVNLNVRIELGRTRMLIEDVLRLNDGSVVELDKLAGDPVDIYVNERHVATGEVLILNETFCVRISEIFKTRAAEEIAASA